VRVRDEDGRERVFNRSGNTAQPKIGTIKIFGHQGQHWGNVGVLSSNMISPDLTAVRGKAQSQVLNGTWSESSRLGSDVWSLEASAKMLTSPSFA
jgi:hypothetical protein